VVVALVDVVVLMVMVMVMVTMIEGADDVLSIVKAVAGAVKCSCVRQWLDMMIVTLAAIVIRPASCTRRESETTWDRWNWDRRKCQLK
jgi:hypothetical protein